MSDDNPPEYTTIDIEVTIDDKTYHTVHKFSVAAGKDRTKKDMILNALEHFKKRLERELS